MGLLITKKGLGVQIKVFQQELLQLVKLLGCCVTKGNYALISLLDVDGGGGMEQFNSPCSFGDYIVG